MKSQITSRISNKKSNGCDFAFEQFGAADATPPFADGKPYMTKRLNDLIEAAMKNADSRLCVKAEERGYPALPKQPILLPKQYVVSAPATITTRKAFQAFTSTLRRARA